MNPVDFILEFYAFVKNSKAQKYEIGAERWGATCNKALQLVLSQECFTPTKAHCLTVGFPVPGKINRLWMWGENWGIYEWNTHRGVLICRKWRTIHVVTVLQAWNTKLKHCGWIFCPTQLTTNHQCKSWPSAQYVAIPLKISHSFSSAWYLTGVTWSTKRTVMQETQTLWSGFGFGWVHSTI